MREIRGDLCHNLLKYKTEPILAFDETKNYGNWKASVRAKFTRLFGIDNISRNSCPLNFQIEKESEKDGYKQIRFTFESEYGAFVPCYLLIPSTGKSKYPVAITLQGHSTGFHNSIGEPKDDRCAEYALGRGAFAIQAVRAGYAALAIEQRGMGECRPSEEKHKDANMCEYTAHIALLLGRTVLGERIWDVSRAIDALDNFDMLDLDDITITGNSGGGTTTFYAACYDERIKLAAPSCAFCSYEASIMNYFHCSCNFVPHAYEWFEMADLACLIAPRRLLIISGKNDEIFPLEGVKDGFKTVKKIYRAAGAADACKMVTTPKGHFWCEDIVWSEIEKLKNQPDM